MTFEDRNEQSNSAIVGTGAGRVLAPIVAALLLAALAVRENHCHPLDFWSHSDGYGDYVNMCLAHALNIDFWLTHSQASRNRQINDDNTLHPGLPLQVTCWVTYRLSYLGKCSDARSRCIEALRDPSRFWMAIRLVAIALAMSSTALLVSAARASGFTYSLAAGLFFFCYDPCWDYSLRLLGNESFALPLALAVAWSAKRSLGSTGKMTLWWLVWGALCALCWLNKLNYIAWTAAAVPAWIFHFWRGRVPLITATLKISTFVLGFVLAAVFLTTLCLGPEGLPRVLGIHIAVLTHSGTYGTGSEQVVASNEVRNAIHGFAVYWHFFLLAALVCAVAVGFFYFQTRRKESRGALASLLSYLIFAGALFLAAALKHYGPHYLIAGVPTGALLMTAMGPHVNGKVRWVMCLAVALAFVQTYRRYTHMAELRYQNIMRMKASLETFDALPKPAGSITLWTYRLPDRRFGMEFTQCYAGVREVAEIIDEQFLLDSRVFYLWRRTVRNGSALMPFPEVKWRYAVFDRGNFNLFLSGPRERDKQYFERNCRLVLDDPTVIAFERIGD